MAKWEKFRLQKCQQKKEMSEVKRMEEKKQTCDECTATQHTPLYSRLRLVIAKTHLPDTRSPSGIDLEVIDQFKNLIDPHFTRDPIPETPVNRAEEQEKILRRINLT